MKIIFLLFFISLKSFSSESIHFNCLNEDKTSNFYIRKSLIGNDRFVLKEIYNEGVIRFFDVSKTIVLNECSLFFTIDDSGKKHENLPGLRLSLKKRKEASGEKFFFAAKFVDFPEDEKSHQTHNEKIDYVVLETSFTLYTGDIVYTSK